MNFGRSSLFHPECANRNIDVRERNRKCWSSYLYNEIYIIKSYCNIVSLKLHMLYFEIPYSS